MRKASRGRLLSPSADSAKGGARRHRHASEPLLDRPSQEEEEEVLEAAAESWLELLLAVKEASVREQNGDVCCPPPRGVTEKCQA